MEEIESTVEASAGVSAPATPEVTSEQMLTQAQIIEEATDAVPLSAGEFLLGGRKFHVVSLGYRQYLQFLAKLEPVLKLVASKVKGGISEAMGSSTRTVAVPGLILTALGDLEPSYLMRFCSDELPEMVEIVCNMQSIKAKDESNLITAKWVEEVAETPFQLIDIVLMQVNKNNMIVQFASFFAQVLPIFMGKTATDQAK